MPTLKMPVLIDVEQVLPLRVLQCRLPNGGRHRGKRHAAHTPNPHRMVSLLVFDPFATHWCPADVPSLDSLHHGSRNNTITTKRSYVRQDSVPDAQSGSAISEPLSAHTVTSDTTDGSQVLFICSTRPPAIDWGVGLS